MKKIFLLLLSFSIFLSTSNSQERMRHGNDQKPLQRIEQWERTKLIDALNLNEETAVRFFARKKESQEKIKEILDKRDETINELENDLRNGNLNDASSKKRVEDLLSIENKIGVERGNFIRSLGDLLSPLQIAKLVVFENKFRKEIRESLMGRGRPPKE